MIWQLDIVDQAIRAAFGPAGQPDQAVIERHLARSARSGRQIRPQADPEEPRFYYLMSDDPRVRLTAVGQRLETWPEDEPAMLVVGTLQIIGEFPANRHLVGKLGLNLKMQPLAWLTGRADLVLANGQALLDEISIQALDRRAIERGGGGKEGKAARPVEDLITRRGEF